MHIFRDVRIHVFVTAEVAQLVEHLVVAQVAVGSSPIFRPIRKSPRFRAGFFFFCRQVTCLEKGPALTPMAVAGSPGTDEPLLLSRAQGRAGMASSFLGGGRAPLSAAGTRPVWKKAKGPSSAGGGLSLMEATALAASGRAALAKAGPFAYKTSHHGAWRSMVAHLLWEQGVAGSNPVAPTIKRSRGHTTMWCDLFLFLRPMAAMPQGVPAGLGKRVQSFPAGVPGAERTRQGGKAPTCKDRQGGCMGRQGRALIPSPGPGSLAGAAVPTPDSPRRGKRV